MGSEDKASFGLSDPETQESQVLSFAFSHCDKHREQKTSLGQKGLINLTPPGSSLSRKEIRAGTRRPELKQRPGKNTACELAPLALAQLSFFFLPSFLLPFLKDLFVYLTCTGIDCCVTV